MRTFSPTSSKLVASSTTMSGTYRRAPVLLACGLVTVIAVAVVGLLPRDVFWITDGGNKLIQIENIRQGGDAPLIDYPGRDIDPEYRFFPSGGHHFLVRNRSVVSFYPPFFPALVAPLFFVLGAWGLYALSVIALVASSALFPALLKASGIRDVPWWTGPAFVFSTPLIFYGVTFWEHAPAFFLGGACIVLIATSLGRNSPALRAAFGGVLAAGSTILREEGYVLVAAVILSLLILNEGRRLVPGFAAGWLAVMSAVWATNLSLFGAALGVHAEVYDSFLGAAGDGGLLSWFKTEMGDAWFFLLRFHENPRISLGVAVPVVLALATGFAPHLRSSRFRVVVLAIAAIGALSGCLALLMHPQPVLHTLSTQGLFPHIAFLVFALIAWRALIRDNDPVVRWLVYLTIAYIYGTVLLLNRADVGIIWGPRHFLVILAPLAALAALGFLRIYSNSNARERTLLSVFGAALVTASVLTQAHGLRVLALKKAATSEMATLVSESQAAMIITDAFWLPEELGSLFFEKKFFQVRSDSELSELAGRLRRFTDEEILVVLSPRYGGISPRMSSTLVDRSSTPPVEFRPQALAFMDLDIIELR